MEPDDILTDFIAFDNQHAPNAVHPANVMLEAGFALRQDGRDEYGHNWDEASAELLDRAYIAGFGNYVARSRRYKEYRSNLPNGSVKLSPIEWVIRHNINWHEIVELLGTDRPNQITGDGLIARADKIAEASQSIRDACGVARGEGPISFCSKYAFFLNGVTPIIDNNAEKALRKMNVGYPAVRGTYSDFVDAFVQFLAIVHPSQESCTSSQIKNLDGYLYEAGRGRWVLERGIQP